MVKKIFVEDIIKQQYLAETAILEEFDEGNYDFEHPLIKVNPYLINPCAAMILFRTSEETAVTITVLGKEPTADISYTYPKNTVHILPILGLYDNCENKVQIRLYQGKTKEFTLRTIGHPMATTVISMDCKPEYLKNQMVLVTPALGGFPTAIDYLGDIRWYLSENMVFAGKRLKNGHLLIGTHRKLRPPYNTTGLYELDMCGKIYKEYRIPGLYHHDMIEMENGDLLVLTQDFSTDSVEDMCVLIDRFTGEIKRTIDFKKFLPRGAAPSGSWDMRDWFHNNALVYDKKTNTLTLSGRHMDALVNIDYTTEKINWIIGDPENWPEEMQKYFFKPIEPKNFEWQYEQHAVVLTDNGDIMCFDNGHWRSKKKEQYLKNAENYSRGVRYSIDTEKMEIRQVWEYGKNRGPEFFSQYISNVEYYGEHNYLIHSGGIQRENGTNVEEFVPPDKMAEAEVISDTVEVYGDKVLWELKVDNNFYRAVKMSLYTDGYQWEAGAGVHLGHLFVSPVCERESLKPCENDVPEDVLLHVIEEEDCFHIKGRFDTDAKVCLYLKNEVEEKGYQINTGFNKFAAVSCLPYIQPDARNKSMSFSKFGLHGTYKVYLSIKDQYYNTNVDISC